MNERNPEGGYCELPPMSGQTRCGSHGGRAPQSRAAAERRLQEEQGRALVATYGLPVHIEWHEALQGSLNEAYGNLLFLRDLVQQITPEALTWGVTQEVTIGSSQFPGIDVTRAAGITPVAQMYERALDRLQKFALDVGKIGLEAHKQRWTESQAADAAQVFRLVFADPEFRLDEYQVAAAPRIAARHLRALAGGEATA